MLEKKKSSRISAKPLARWGDHRKEDGACGKGNTTSSRNSTTKDVEKFQCSHCKKYYKSKPGFTQHRRICTKAPAPPNKLDPPRKSYDVTGKVALPCSQEQYPPEANKVQSQCLGEHSQQQSYTIAFTTPTRSFADAAKQITPHAVPLPLVEDTLIGEDFDITIAYDGENDSTTTNIVNDTFVNTNPVPHNTVTFVETSTEEEAVTTVSPPDDTVYSQVSIQSTTTTTETTTTTTRVPTPIQNERENDIDPVQFLNDSSCVLSQLMSDTNEDIPIFIEEKCEIIANLPPYTEVHVQPSTNYNNVPPNTFVSNISTIYEEMTKWRKNLFLVPTGGAGKSFVKLIAEWLGNYNKSNTFQGIAMKVIMVLPNILLQKPSAKSKAKEHLKLLEDRLKLWNEGKIPELFRDCKVLQKKLASNKKQRTPQDINKIFSKLIFEGKPGAAIKFLDEHAENSVLPSSETIINKLKFLHPTPAEILPNTLLEGPIEEVSPAIFASIDEEEVLKAANRTKGAAGPSMFEAKQWRRILGSKKYAKEGKELREEIARFARKIATEVVDPQTLETYIASRLIPLNKTPGEADPQVRPIGVGEVLRRIAGKTISWALSQEIQDAGGSLQVSTGLKGGGEAAIHAMKEIFDSQSVDGVILVDAENAFNKLNRQAALHNMQYICPAFAVVLINTYRKQTRLFIVGGGEIPSAEGTTQGDALAMQFYGLSTKPIMLCLDYKQTHVYQVWLADDATGAGTLNNLKQWWDIVSVEGRKYGYYVKPSKSWLILKDKNKLQEAERIFENSQIQITTDGKRHLGAALGTEEFKVSYMEEKVENWCKTLKKLTNIAKGQPHAAYAGYLHAEQHKYTYFMRTITNTKDLLAPLDEIITHELLPALFGGNITPNERDLVALPIKEGGLGFRKWTNEADISYTTSKTFTKPLQEQIRKQDMDLPSPEDVSKAKCEALSAKTQIEKRQKAATTEKQNDSMKRNLEQLSDPGASSWLSAHPLKDHNFDLSKGEFHDALNLRYDKPLKNLPKKCPCGKPFDITHAMNCHRGGFINNRHDNVRDYEASLLKKVCNDVQVEPLLQPCDGFNFGQSVNKRPDARADVRAKGFWRDGQNAFFDVQVTNADCASQRERTIKAIMKSKEVAKKTMYNIRIMEVEHGSFTPLIFSAKGVMGPECRSFHKTLAGKISDKTGERYEEVVRMTKVKLSFLIMKAALMCVRGSRSIYKTRESNNDEDFGFALNELGLAG